MIGALLHGVGQVLLFCLTMNLVLAVVVGMIVMQGWLMRHVNQLTRRRRVTK